MSLCRLLAVLAARDSRFCIIRANLLASLDVGLCNLCQIDAFARRSGCLKRLRDYDPSKSRDVSKNIEKIWKEQIQKHRFAREPDPSVGRHRVRVLPPPKAFPCAHLNAVSLAAPKVCRVINHASWNQLIKK